MSWVGVVKWTKDRGNDKGAEEGQETETRNERKRQTEKSGREKERRRRGNPSNVGLKNNKKIRAIPFNDKILINLKFF